jgi:zinc transporter ZupT
VGFVADKVVLGQVFPRVLRVSPVNLIPTDAPLLGKMKKKLIIFLIIFIIGLHNKPYGCGVSVAYAAGPFSIKTAIFKSEAVE